MVFLWFKTAECTIFHKEIWKYNLSLKNLRNIEYLESHGLLIFSYTAFPSTFFQKIWILVYNKKTYFIFKYWYSSLVLVTKIYLVLSISFLKLIFLKPQTFNGLGLLYFTVPWTNNTTVTFYLFLHSFSIKYYTLCKFLSLKNKNRILTNIWLANKGRERFTCYLFIIP